MKAKKDPNTKGKGDSTLDKIKSLLGLESDAGLNDGSDTSADDEEGKKKTPEALDGTDNDSDSDAADDNDSDDDNADDDSDSKDDDDSDDDAEPKKDDKKKAAKKIELTQEELDEIIKKRLAKQKKSMSKEGTDSEAKLKQLEAIVAGFVEKENAAVKAEYDKLPEVIRDLAPAEADTPEGIEAIKAWMPKAKSLVAKLEKKDPKKGNGNDFKPKGKPATDIDEDTLKSVRQHSIYRGGL